MIRNLFFVFSLLFCAIGANAQQVDTTALFKEAGQLFSEKKFEEGVVKLNQVLAAYPNLKEALYARGAAYLKLRRYDKAQPDIFKALPQYADATERYIQVGWAILQGAKDEDVSFSMPYFEEGLKRNPNSCEAHLGKGLAFYRQKMYAESLPSFETGTKICGESANEANLYLCNALYLGGKKTEAYQALDKMIAQNQKNTDGLLLRIDWYKQENQFEKALADANQLIAKEPKIGKWYSQRALIYAGMKRREDACSDVLRAEELGDYNGVMQLGAQCKQPASTVVLKAGSVLKYQFESYGDISKITLKLTEYGPKRIAFTWEMEGATVAKGSVAMGSAALDSANVLLAPINLNNGENTDSPVKSAFFLSRKALELFKNFSDFRLDTGMLPESYGSIAPSSHTVRMSGLYQELPAFSVSTNRFDQNIYILDDPNVPLVLKMELGIGGTVTLIEVQP